MTWKATITAVAAAIGRTDEGVAMIDALERGAAGRPFSLEGIDVDAFLAELDRTLRREHVRWSPTLLAEAGAVLSMLPPVFSLLSTVSAEWPLEPDLVRSGLQRLAEHAVVKPEPLGRDGTRCPRCGSANVKTQKTTATGRLLYEHLCFRCGWFDDEDLGPAPDYGSRS